MAELLYKIGAFSARRAWYVIAAWVLILAATLGSMVAFSGKLSSSMSISGLPAQLVADSLQQTFPSAAHASGKVVFHKTNGEAFTAQEKAAIADVIAEAEKLESVDDIVDPFAAQVDRAEGLKELADGQKALADAPELLAEKQTELDKGAKKLAAAEVDLLANEAKLNDGIKKVKGGIAQLQALNPAPPGAAQQLVGLQQQLAGLEANLVKLNDGKAELAKQKVKLADGQAKIDEALADLDGNRAKLENAQTIADSAAKYLLVSDDGQTAVATVIFNKSTSEIQTEDKTPVIEKLSELKQQNVAVEFSQELMQSLEGLLGPGEIAGLLIAAIVLFVMLGTLIGAGLPVLSAILGVGVSATLTMSLSGVIDMTSTTPALGVMLGLAVGIDYSLFILNRHRRQLKTGQELRESIALANGTSGNAVLFAGLTVVIALVALNLTGIDFLGLMGDFAAVAVLISVLVAVTFIPALLSLVGFKVLSRKERRALAELEAHPQSEEAETGIIEKLKRPVFATRHPWLTVFASVTLLVIAALPVSQLRLGLPDGSSNPIESTQYRAFTLISEQFGAGQNGQVIGVVTLPEKLDDDALTAFQASAATEIMALDSVAAVVPADTSSDGKSVLFAVLPTEGPSAESTEALVENLRALDGYFVSEYSGSWGVTGMTAINTDMAKKLAEALPLYLGVVLALSLLLLVMVFRSLLVPVIASLGFLLTIFATIGAVVAVYQWGWFGWLFDIHEPGPVLSILPTMLIGILFGLAMDYQLFLVSGMREAYVHGDTAREAVNHGVRSGRAVVIAAAIIMVTVFGGFAFSHLTMVRPIGLGLAVGVLIDAFMVRLLIVPATMHILGKSAWYLPKWLDRILPDLDVEGAKLERAHGK